MKKLLSVVLCVLTMFSLFAFSSTVNAATVLYCDANGGAVNVSDAILIAMYSAGLIKKFPADKINGPIILPPIEF